MDWLAHDRLGFNYRLSDVAAALGVAQLERLDALLAERERVAALYRERLAGDRGPGAARARTRARSGAAGSCSWCRCPQGVDRDGVIGRARRARASPPRRTCPASTSSRFYRERFGFAGGEFPVAERRRGPLAGAAVLHRDGRGARWSGSRGRARSRARRADRAR